MRASRARQPRNVVHTPRACPETLAGSEKDRVLQGDTQGRVARLEPADSARLFAGKLRFLPRDFRFLPRDFRFFPRNESFPP